MTINRAAGTVIFVLGLLVVTYSLHLHVGKLSHMGPGFFPLAIGIAFSIVGAIIFFSNNHDSKKLEITSKEIRAVSVTLAAVCAFAWLAQYLGMIVACMALVVIARYSIDYGTLKEKIKLSLILTASSVFIFWYLLNMNFKLFLTLF